MALPLPGRSLTLLLCVAVHGVLPFACLAGGIEASAWKPERAGSWFYMGHRFRLEQALPDVFAPGWGQGARTLYQANLVAGADLEWKRFGRVSIVLDSGELSEETIRDGCLDNARSEDAFFQEGSFETTFLDDKGLAFKVGQQPVIAGAHYILDDFLLAGQVGLDLHRMLGLPLEVYGTLARVRGSSLYVQLKAVHPFSAYQTLGLSVGWLWDREGLFAEILTDVLSRLSWARPDRPRFRSRSDIVWFALSGERTVCSFRISLVGILETGRVRLSWQDGRGGELRSNFTTLGYLVDLGVGRNLTEDLSVDIFYLMASGDGDPVGSIRAGKRLDAYLAIVPFITRTNLFFSGGINENFSTRSLGMAGNSARGFGVPGITVTYFLTENLWLKGVGAYLFAPASPPGTAAGRTYGWEVDLTAYWDVGGHARLSLEGDLFRPGSFFDRSGRTKPEDAYRVMAGLDLFF